ncbi:MAG: hypothetical protein ABI671_12120 [Burkholderiales bacterium]
MMQAALFEPTGVEVGPLALMHVKKAASFRRAAEVFTSRGWEALARDHARLAEGHDQEAECLGMLAHFERLGGVYA